MRPSLSSSSSLTRSRGASTVASASVLSTPSAGLPALLQEFKESLTRQRSFVRLLSYSLECLSKVTPTHANITCVINSGILDVLTSAVAPHAGNDALNLQWLQLVNRFLAQADEGQRRAILAAIGPSLDALRSRFSSASPAVQQQLIAINAAFSGSQDNSSAMQRVGLTEFVVRQLSGLCSAGQRGSVLPTALSSLTRQFGFKQINFTGEFAALMQSNAIDLLVSLLSQPADASSCPPGAITSFLCSLARSGDAALLKYLKLADLNLVSVLFDAANRYSMELSTLSSISEILSHLTDLSQLDLTIMAIKGGAANALHWAQLCGLMLVEANVDHFLANGGLDFIVEFISSWLSSGSPIDDSMFLSAMRVLERVLARSTAAQRLHNHAIIGTLVGLLAKASAAAALDSSSPLLSLLESVFGVLSRVSSHLLLSRGSADCSHFVHCLTQMGGLDAIRQLLHRHHKCVALLIPALQLLSSMSELPGCRGLMLARDWNRLLIDLMHEAEWIEEGGVKRRPIGRKELRKAAMQLFAMLEWSDAGDEEITRFRETVLPIIKSIESEDDAGDGRALLEAAFRAIQKMASGDPELVFQFEEVDAALEALEESQDSDIRAAAKEFKMKMKNLKNMGDVHRASVSMAAAQQAADALRAQQIMIAEAQLEAEEAQARARAQAAAAARNSVSQSQPLAAAAAAPVAPAKSAKSAIDLDWEASQARIRENLARAKRAEQERAKAAEAERLARLKREEEEMLFFLSRAKELEREAAEQERIRQAQLAEERARQARQEQEQRLRWLKQINRTALIQKPPLNAQVRQFLTNGIFLMKHSKSAPPRQRLVYLSSDCKYLCWTEEKTPPPKPARETRFKVDRLTSVTKGRCTQQLQRKSLFGKYLAKEECCFSVKGRSDDENEQFERTLDLEVARVEDFDRVFDAFKALVEWGLFDSLRKYEEIHQAEQISACSPGASGSVEDMMPPPPPPPEDEMPPPPPPED